MEPQDEIASDFMARKGYPKITAFIVDKIEGIPCWYYVYDLPEGRLELEVFYDDRRHDWETRVTTFTIAS